VVFYDVALFRQYVVVCCLIFIYCHPIMLYSPLNTSFLLYSELLRLNKNYVRKELMLPKRRASTIKADRSIVHYC
jgi:hypothetical protein